MSSQGPSEGTEDGLCFIPYQVPALKSPRCGTCSVSIWNTLERSWTTEENHAWMTEAPCGPHAAYSTLAEATEL